MYQPFCFQLMPWIPSNCDEPPTLYAILNSLLNYDNNVKTKIKDLAKNGHQLIFDFEYPISAKINKDDFETMILNHFIMRRIGYETVTAFKIALNVKMNEIMPYYNVILDSITGWDLFQDGEKVTRIQNEKRNSNTTSTSESTGTVRTEDITNQDLRYSNLPQNQLEDVQNGTYMTEYNYNTNEGKSTTNTNSIQDDTTNNEDSGVIEESISRSVMDKTLLLKNYMEQTKTIYSLIFKDLDCLFYGLHI